MNGFSMQIVDGWSTSPGALRLGSALLHFAWQGAVCAGVVLVLLALLRRARPHVRYAALLAVFGAMTVCPIVTYFVVDVPVAGEVPSRVEPPTNPEFNRPDPIAVLPPADVPAIESAAMAPVEPVEPAPSLPLIEPAANSPPSAISWKQRLATTRDWLDRNRPRLVAAWLVGVALLSLRLATGLVGAERARRRGTSAPGAMIGETVARLAARLGIRHPVRVFESALAEVPTLVGWLRPVILLPASAVSGLTASQLEAILAHELAHVRRHDYLVNLLQTVVETVLFYHPAVWWLSRRIRSEREHCCDDVAVEICRDRVGYARALAAMAEMRNTPRWAVAARGGSLLARVRRLVDRPEPSSGGRLALVLVAVIVLLAGGVTVHFRKQVAADEPAIAEDESSSGPASPDTPEPQRLAGFPDLALVEREIGAVPFQQEDSVNSIAWLDSGRSLLVTSRHNNLRVYDVATRRLVREIEKVGHNDVFASVDRSGKRIAVLGAYANVRLLEWPSGKILREIPAQGRAISLSPDGSKLAVAAGSGDKNGLLTIFDADTGDVLSERRGPPTYALCWTPDSRLLAAGERRGIVVFLKPDGTLVRPGITLEDAEPPLALAFDEPGERLAILTVGGNGGIWQVSGRKLVWTWKAQYTGKNILADGSFGGISFIDGGRRLFAQSTRTTMVFEAATGKVAKDWGFQWAFANTPVSPDGRLVARATPRNAVDLHSVATLESTLPKEELAAHSFGTLRLSPDRKTLATRGADNSRIDFWDADAMRYVVGVDVGGYFEDFCFSPDGRRVAVAHFGKAKQPAAAVIIDPQNLKIIQTLPLEEHAVRGVAFTPDGRRLAVAEVRHLSLWDLETGVRQWRVPACDEADWLERVAVSPDGERIAVVTMFRQPRGSVRSMNDASRGAIRLFQVATGENLGQLLTAGTPTRLEFQNSSTLLAAMERVATGGGPVAVVVEWDVAERVLHTDRAIVYPNTGPTWSLFSCHAADHRLLVGCPLPTIGTEELALWDLDGHEELRRFRLPWSIADAQLLNGNRLVLLKRNGNLVVLQIPRAVPPEQGMSDAEALAARFVAALERQTLSFIGEPQLAALRTEVHDYLAERLREPMPGPRRERLLLAIEEYVQRNMPASGGDSVYLAFRGLFDTLKWELWIAAARPELDAEQRTRLDAQRKWMRDVIETVPAQQGFARERAVAELEKVWNDPLVPFFQDPLSGEELADYKLRVQSRNPTLVNVHHVLFQEIIRVGLEALRQRWPTQNSAWGGANMEWGFNGTPSSGGSNDLPDVTKRASSVYLDVTRGVYTPGTRPNDPAAREEWLEEQGQGDLCYDGKLDALIAVRGAKLAVLEATNWAAADQMKLADLRRLVAEQGQESLPLTKFITPREPLRGSFRDALPDGPSLVVLTREEKIAVARFYSFGDGPMLKVRPRPLPPNPPLYPGDAADERAVPHVNDPVLPRPAKRSVDVDFEDAEDAPPPAPARGAAATVKSFVNAFFPRPKLPATYRFRVVTAQGAPVAGAKVSLSSVGHKSGASLDLREQAPPAATTDADGNVQVGPIKLPAGIDELFSLMPRHPDDAMMDEIDDGPSIDRLSLRIEHPDHPLWFDTVAVARREPIVLPDSATLEIRTRPAPGSPEKIDLYPLLGWLPRDRADWSVKDGVLTIRRVDLTSKYAVRWLRVIGVAEQGPALFSDPIDLKQLSGNPISLDVTLKPGARVLGRLIENVPRPVKNGRVVATVISTTGTESHTHWAAAADVAPDGTFTLDSLPADENLQLIAVCDGWVSSSPTKAEVEDYAARHQFVLPKNFAIFPQIVYPRLVRLASGTVETVVPMEPGLACEVTVVDRAGKPISETFVQFMPNQMWLGGGTTLLGEGTDALATIRGDPTPRAAPAPAEPATPEGRWITTTDARGVATIRGLPAGFSAERNEPRSFMFLVMHKDYVVPTNPTTGQFRTVTIPPGEPGQVSVRMRRR